MNKTSVAEFLNQKINESELSQKEMADIIGFSNPNIITMIKQGLTKVAISRVPKLAKVLNVDPAELLNRVYQEYDPDTYSAITNILGEPKTVLEKKILKTVNEFLAFDLLESDAEKEEYINKLDGVLHNIKKVMQAI